MSNSLLTDASKAVPASLRRRSEYLPPAPRGFTASALLRVWALGFSVIGIDGANSAVATAVAASTAVAGRMPGAPVGLPAIVPMRLWHRKAHRFSESRRAEHL